MNETIIPRPLFIRLGLCLLILGAILGTFASFSFIDPDHFNRWFPFQKLRPLHVSSVVFWILTAAIGVVLRFFESEMGLELKYKILIRISFYLWLFTIPLIFISYFRGQFGGREYWEYPPIFSVPIMLAWILIAITYFANLKNYKYTKPVYLWMWGTGFVFFIITFSESTLWTIPWFRINIITDITIQWKSNGSLVGSWNMLIYGSGIYLMQIISGDKKAANNNLAFVFYFLGLINLMFNWGHHTYLLPAAIWIQYISYTISMTEWIILLRRINSWKQTLNAINQYKHYYPYMFIAASEWWIFANLFLAILMSIPAVNIYTHGTHVTVAHAMGTTIGINSNILLACIAHIFHPTPYTPDKHWNRIWLSGFWAIQVSLVVFWVSLISAGIIKGIQVFGFKQHNFNLVMAPVYPMLKVFAVAGVTLCIGIIIICILLLSKSLNPKPVVVPIKSKY